jgi:acyl-CoA synthetase (NDP forming)
LKLARGESGAAAALSHTGSLAGEEASWRALFDDVGAIVVDNFEDIVETAAFFGKASHAPKAQGAAVLAASGGAAIMAADCAEAHSVALPQPTAPVKAILEQRIPPFGSSRNPCDVTAQVLSDQKSLIDCVDALLSDSNYGA